MLLANLPIPCEISSQLPAGTVSDWLWVVLRCPFPVVGHHGKQIHTPRIHTHGLYKQLALANLSDFLSFLLAPFPSLLLFDFSSRVG